jgi:membrane-bound lytic murein transglycosylase F
MTGRRFATLFVAVLLAACTESPKPIAPIAESGELVVLTVNGPVTYFEDAQGLPSGFEYDLATLFARELHAKPVFVLIDDPTRADRILRAGQAHLSAAALPRHFDFPGGLAWGPPYLTTQHQIVGRAGAEPARPRALKDLGKQSVGVIEESVAEYLMLAPALLGTRVERLPAGTSTADMLEQVARGTLDYALVESNRFTLARRFFPQLEVAFDVGKPVEYAWLVSPVDKRRILEAAKPFFERIRKDGTLKRLVDRYYGHAARLTAIDSVTLLERIRTQLPDLKPFFQEAEVASGSDWRLLAAIGYQESHWDAKATSPTGVRGLMMLTEETATRLQIKDRLDARDSIVGGARYLSLLKEGIPPRIPEPDRTFLALAAYNLGLGHLEDARILATRAGLNADKWQDVRQVLPRLGEPEHYHATKHGYARGSEGQVLVDNVRNYYDILARAFPRDAPALPATDPSRSALDEGRRFGQVIGVVPGLQRPGVGVEGHGVVRRVRDRHLVRVREGNAVHDPVENRQHAAVGHDRDSLSGVLAGQRLEGQAHALVELAPRLAAGDRGIGIGVEGAGEHAGPARVHLVIGQSLALAERALAQARVGNDREAPQCAAIRSAVWIARPRSLATSTSKRSRARRAPIASAWARPAGVRSLSFWPWMRAATFQCVSPWRMTMKRVRTVTRTPRLRAGPGSNLSIPPMNGTSAFGTVTEPSAFW